MGARAESEEEGHQKNHRVKTGEATTAEGGRNSQTDPIFNKEEL